MFYFKSVIINAVDSKTVELAIRQFAAKRFTFLDIHSSTTYVVDEKLFLGFENEKSIKITRIRSPFSLFLPKLVLKFDKAQGFTRYKIRYSLIPSFVLFFFVIAIIGMTVHLINYGRLDMDMINTLFLFSIFIMLTIAEIKQVQKKLEMAINLTTRATDKASDTNA